MSNGKPDASPERPGALHALLDVPYHGFWLFNEEHVATFANQTLVELLGGLSLVGQRLEERVVPSERAQLLERLDTLQLGVSCELDVSIQTITGLEISVRMWLSPHFDASGDYKGYVAIVRSHHDVANQTDESRMLTAGQVTQYLTAGVAHSLNTSLQTIVGFADLITEMSELPEHIRSPLQQLQHSAQSATRLVMHLLSLTDLGDTVPAALTLQGVLEECIASREAYLIANNVTINRPDATSAAYVWANPPRLRRAVAHLFSNACMMVVEHGGGTLDLLIDSQEDQIELRIRAVGCRYEASIVNFEPTQVTRNFGDRVMLHALGTGIIRELDGTVSAENTEESALLTVTLPRAPQAVLETYLEASTPLLSSAASGAPGALESSRVLIIDDEPAILELSEQALLAHCEVVTCDSADDALALLDNERFDLVVSDLRMPGAIDGLGLYRFVKDMNPSQADRFVFTTADTVSRQASGFLAESGRPYLKKPFTLKSYRHFVFDEIRLANIRSADNDG